MTTKQKMLVGLGLIAALAAVSWGVLKTRSTEPNDDLWKTAEDTTSLRAGEGPWTPEEELILGHTVPLTLHYEKMGAYWMKVLDNELAPNERRVYASKVLGLMKYPPAIPILTKHALFREAWLKRMYKENEGDDIFVADIALYQYENAAVPEIVNSYLDGQDRYNSLFGYSLRNVTETYLAGLVAQQDPRLTPDVIRTLQDDYRFVLSPLSTAPTKQP